MSIFRFKRFSVTNDLSALKVNTDGVLLGATAHLPVDRTSHSKPFRALDVGTGTGVIALMIAQRLSDVERDFEIVGIDIDQAAAKEAEENFRLSPWDRHLKSENIDLKDFEPNGEWDLIVSNPPYFEMSLVCPEERKALAKHSSGEALTLVDLLDFAGRTLARDGVLSLILPSDRERELCRLAAAYGLAPLRLLRIRTTPRKSPSRLIADFRRTSASDASPIEDELIIQDPVLYPDNRSCYTPEYLSLTSDFYLF